MSPLLIFFLLGQPQISHADKIDLHRKEMVEYLKATDEYERRLERLKTKKDQAQEGPELDGILDDIATLHKDILRFRQKKTLLSEHLKKDHPGEEVVTDLSLLRQDEKEAAKVKKDTASASKTPAKTAIDEALDRRMDLLLNRIQEQYARTIKEHAVPLAKKTNLAAGEDLPTDKPGEKKKMIPQEEKDRYLKEKIKGTIKVE